MNKDNDGNKYAAIALGLFLLASTVEFILTNLGV